MRSHSKESIYQEFLNNLIKKLHQFDKQKISQPEFLKIRVKKQIEKYFENMAIIDHDNDLKKIEDSNNGRIDNKKQRALFLILNSHLKIIEKEEFSSFNFDIKVIFNIVLMEKFDKYKFNISDNERLELIKTNIESANDSKNIASSAIREDDKQLDWKKLGSYPLYSLFQESNQYFARVSQYCVFAKITNANANPTIFKAYYINQYHKKWSPQGKVVLETKPDGIFIKQWEDSAKMVTEKKLAERPLTSYEIDDFELGIQEFQKMNQGVFQIFKENNQYLKIPTELIHLIIHYLAYDITAKIIGQLDYIGFNGPKLNFPTEPGLELFDSMKTGMVYSKHDQIFYYCDSLHLIYSWTKKTILKREQCKEYHCLNPFEETFHDQRQAGDPIVHEQPHRGISFNTLQFLASAIKTYPKGKKVLQYTEEICPGISKHLQFKMN